MTVTEFLFGWIGKTAQEDTPLDLIVSWSEALILIGLIMFLGDIIDFIKNHKE